MIMSAVTYTTIVWLAAASVYALHHMKSYDLRGLHTAEAVASWVRSLGCENTDEFLDAVMAHLSQFTYDELLILHHRYEKMLAGLPDPCGEHAFCLTLVYSALRLRKAFYETSTRTPHAR